MKSWPAEVAGADAPEPRLDDRVRELLGNIGGRLAFNGLRRALGVHPESLTRALRRLEREGVVQRRADGYVLADPGSYAAEPHLTPP
ncbi:MAG: GntR family transcriptional regulator, partial [Thermoplasmata archaeon]|nr:GntR family transcriptional regulator [Thermoplasmata archaeon]